MVEPVELSHNREQSRKLLEDDLFVEDPEFSQQEEWSQNGCKKDSRQKRKRAKKKKSPKSDQTDKPARITTQDQPDEKIDIEFVPEDIHLDKHYAEFSKVFEHFKFSNSNNITVEKADEGKKSHAVTKAAELERLKRMMEDEEEEEREKSSEKLSKKKLKLQTRISVAALKQLVARPDVVEMYDVTARDPKLLVHLKGCRNTVQVPRHWCAKRKYLQGKRGFEKPPFELPDFIKRTGIQSMREAVQDKDKNKSLKQKMKEKVRPKVGRIDIDYQKLHDAFFKWQTKPKMTIHGDLYYEGKELEAKLKEKKPGNLTDELRVALGMPTGPSADKVPPPWLIAMQRYGPPPSYPNLKIPGLNAPIPDACSFGYHAGGWGKPPVDEFGRPLYGDVFGATVSVRRPEEDEPVDTSLWGEMEEEYYEEAMPGEDEDEEEEEEEAAGQPGQEMDQEVEEAGMKTPGEGLITPSGISSSVTSVGLETPDMIELRKRKHQIESEMEAGVGTETPVLYKVLPEKAAAVGASMMGSSKVYDISAAKKVTADVSGITSTLELSLNPDDLEAQSEDLQSKIEQKNLEENKNAKRKKKEIAAAAAAAASTAADKDKSKKYKEFKF
ncbi:Splicing factor 3B subunit 2 [Brachionus plicatilis]|uniref:Splicing factor 3B subunit 2 n=1 Tax=Brachionus plicatilis TaxID=10195 RepID=A0A3M7QMR2_BRAPC|nr:Splicing factor 3B subunit 2 [Brachionus plicatilis]